MPINYISEKHLDNGDIVDVSLKFTNGSNTENGFFKSRGIVESVDSTFFTIVPYDETDADPLENGGEIFFIDDKVSRSNDLMFIEVPKERLISTVITRNECLEKIRNKLDNLVFRRAGKVLKHDKDFCNAIIYNYNGDKICYKDYTEYLDSTSVEERERIGEESFKWWYAFTTTTTLRNNEPEELRGNSLWFGKCNFKLFDTETTFQFLPLDNENVKKDVQISSRKPPVFREIRTNSGRIDKKSSLICGHVAYNSKRRGYYYKKWFYCSEQFYKLYTLIVQEQETEKTPSKVIRKLRSNNTPLYISKLQKEGVSEKEIAEKYRVYRTEKTGEKWYAVYQVIAMFFYYGNTLEEIHKELISQYGTTAVYDKNLIKNIIQPFLG